jgi:glutamate-5-semialdehyde dehydrogenase
VSYDDQAKALTDRARAATVQMRSASTAQKNAVLRRVAERIVAEKATILAANAQDVAAGETGGLSAALLDRLRLDEARLDSLAAAVAQVADLPDPVGAIDGLRQQPSGIQVGRMRIPLGTVLIVYESRPNVTVDAASLCLKTGNAVILRGGKEARHSNRALADVVRSALVAEGLPEDAALLIDDPDRELLYALLRRSGEIDLAIPRGGTGLIDAVNAHARVPVVQHYEGICHVYVHAEADLHKAVDICVNAKAQRPGVCNAAEGFIVDASVADTFLPMLVDGLRGKDVELRLDERALDIVGERDGVNPASAADFDTEFLDLICSVAVVDGYDEARAFLGEHSSGHTEAICTRDHDIAMRFVRDIEASCVLVNASTRFNDGGELGLGAELGISTTKLHAYGPMGLEELTTRKFVVLGHGEVRQ